MTKYNCCIAQLRNVPGANSIKTVCRRGMCWSPCHAHSSGFCESCKNWTLIAQTLVKSYRYMHSWKKDGDFLFTGRHREQTGGNRYKLHEERFHLDFDSLTKKKKKEKLQVEQSPTRKSSPGMEWSAHNWRLTRCDWTGWQSHPFPLKSWTRWSLKLHSHLGWIYMCRKFLI